MEESERFTGFYLYGDSFDNWVSGFNKQIGVVLRLWEIKEKEGVVKLDFLKVSKEMNVRKIRNLENTKTLEMFLFFYFLFFHLFLLVGG